MTAPILEEHMKKLLSFGVVAGVMLAVSGTAQAFECKVKESSMDKPASEADTIETVRKLIG